MSTAEMHLQVPTVWVHTVPWPLSAVDIVTHSMSSLRWHAHPSKSTRAWLYFAKWIMPLLVSPYGIVMFQPLIIFYIKPGSYSYAINPLAH